MLSGGPMLSERIDACRLRRLELRLYYWFTSGELVDLLLRERILDCLFIFCKNIRTLFGSFSR